MNTKDEPLTTKDLARTAHDDVRGRRDEPLIGQEAVAEPPASSRLRPQPESVPRRDEPLRRTDAKSDDRTAHTPLFAERDATELRKRWAEAQTGFVDEPRRAVEQADSLVADAMKRLAESFATERATLEKQWDRGDNVTTEDLRVALQRYRSFFDRLLTV